MAERVSTSQPIGTYEIDIMEVAEGIYVTLKMKNLKQLKVRFFAATTLLRLAIWVGGWGGMEIEEDEGASSN